MPPASTAPALRIGFLFRLVLRPRRPHQSHGVWRINGSSTKKKDISKGLSQNKSLSVWVQGGALVVFGESGGPLLAAKEVLRATHMAMSLPRGLNVVGPTSDRV